MASSDPPPETAASEPAPAEHVTPPAPADDASFLTDPMRALPWIAALGVAALVLGRFVAPALPGAFVGAGRTVRLFELLGGGLSQLFAFTAIFTLSTALIAAANSSMSVWLRLTAMAVSAYTSLVVFGGALSNDHVPELSALIAATMSGSFAIVAAIAARSSPVTRLPAVVLGLIGSATLLRAIFGFVDVLASSKIAPETLTSAGRAISTAAAIAVALSLLLALVHVGRSTRSNEEGGAQTSSSLWSPLTLAALVLAIVCARQAIVGGSPDASGLSVVLKRASDRFLLHPEPHLRLPVRLFLGFLTPITAAALLLVRRLRTLTAALALALIAADIAGAPLAGVALVLASMGVLLVAKSGHVLWSALGARSPAPRS